MSIKKGDNSAFIQLKLKLLNHVNKHCGDEQQSRGFYIAKRWLMYDPKIREELGEECYQEMLAWYSKTNIQQQEERELKEKLREKREQQKLEIEQIKVKAYASQTGLGVSKREEKDELKREAQAIEQEENAEREHQQLLNEKSKLEKGIVSIKARMEKFKDNVEYANPPDDGKIRWTTLVKDEKELSEIKNQLAQVNAKLQTKESKEGDKEHE